MTGTTRTPSPLDALVGRWRVGVLQADGTEDLAGTCVFAWTLDGAFLVQDSEAPVAEVPDSTAFVAATDTGYTYHYFDSRGVVRLYAMTLDDRTWRLERTTPDFSPLHFHQRFVGTFTDPDTIDGAWEMSRDDGATWAVDFPLRYRRVID